MPKQHIAVLSDFDGTLTEFMVLHALYEQFADPVTRRANEQWNRGEISTQEETEICFATITATRKEMEAYLDTICIDPGLPRLVDWCASRQAPFAVVSDGFRWYIEYVLKHNGLTGQTIYANEIEFAAEGFKFSYPYAGSDDPLLGISKPAIVRRYQEQGYRVAYLGDGNTDTQAIRAADLVFAKGWLYEYACSQIIDAMEFVSLDDVIHCLSSQELECRG